MFFLRLWLLNRKTALAPLFFFAKAILAPTVWHGFMVGARALSNASVMSLWHNIN
jgi:hypothetical protein